MQTIKFILVMLLVGVCTQIHAQDVQTALSGKWQFNREQSDDVQAKVKAAIGGDGGGIRGKLKRNRAQAALEQFSDSVRLLSLQVEESQVVIQTNDRQARTLKTDGSKQSYTTPRGKQATTTAEWRGGRLVVNTTTAEGAKFSQTFSLSGGQLQVNTRVEADRLGSPLTIRAVYDPVESSKS